MESDVLKSLSRGGGDGDDPWQTLSVAINADSMATWFSPWRGPIAGRAPLAG